MTDAKFELLRARLFEERAKDVTSSLKAVERLFPLTERHRRVLLEFGGPICFEKGAFFRAAESNPWARKDNGCNSLNMLLGLGEGDFSIMDNVKRTEGELPPSFVPIAESPGGNLVCVDKHGIVYFWDHESMRDEGYWKVAETVNDFFDRLKPDDSPPTDISGIVDAWLDF